MVKKKNKNPLKEIKVVAEKKLVSPAIPDIEPEISAQELYHKLSTDDKQEILKMIIDEGGIAQLASVVQDINTPGAVDLLLDKIEYYHFYPSVKDPGWEHQ